MKSALYKLGQTDEMPEYLKARMKQQQKKSWFAKIFSTHPEMLDRITSLERKIEKKLPFNYYISTFQKIRSSLSFFLQWKI